MGTLHQRALGEWSGDEASRKQKGRLSVSSTSILAEWVQVFSTARLDRAHSDRACVRSSLAGAVQMLSTVRVHQASSECSMLKMVSP